MKVPFLLIFFLDEDSLCQILFLLPFTLKGQFMIQQAKERCFDLFGQHSLSSFSWVH